MRMVHRFLRLFIVSLSLLVPQPLLAVEFPATDILLDTPLTASPNISVNPDLSADVNGNVYTVWEDNRNGPGTIFFNHRFPEGDWEPRAISLTTGNPKNIDVEQGDATDAHICSDNSGHIYVVWIDNRANKSGTGKRDLYLRYSRDFGTTWLPEFIDYRIDTDTPRLGDSLAPEIACDEGGHLYVVWLDDRNVPGRYDVYFRSLQFDFEAPGNQITPLQSTDTRLNLGVSGKPHDGGTYRAYPPRIATNGSGVIYAVWEDSREAADNEIFPGIYINVSRDWGAHWNAFDTRLDHRPLGFFRSTSPQVAADNGSTLHVIWLDTGPRPLQQIETAGRYKLFYNHSFDYGLTWQEADQVISNVDKTAEVADASISVNNKRGVFAAWTDNRKPGATGGDQQNVSGQLFHVYFNHSENLGFRWLNADKNIQLDVDNTTSDAVNPNIVSDNLRNVFVSWEDHRHGYQDLYFNLSPDSGQTGTWQDHEIRVDRAVSGNSTGTRLRTDDNGQIHLVWKDDRKAFGRSNIYYNGLLLDRLTLSKGPRAGSACFIATAAFGSPFEPHVHLLRQFRDQVLLSHGPGRYLVAWYYRISPPIADLLERHPAAKPVVRAMLLPAVWTASFFLETPVAWQVLIVTSLLFLAVAVWFRWKMRSTRTPNPIQGL